MKLTATTSTGSNISSKYKSHVLLVVVFFLFEIKFCSVFFFYSFSIYNFHVPFLRLFKRSLWLLHFSDYNWYGMGCDTMQSGAMFIYFTFNRLIRNTLFVIPVVTWKEHLNTHISICLMYSRFCGICKCNRAH